MGFRLGDIADHTDNGALRGIQTVEHLCRINLGGRMETVKLVYTKESCKWAIVEL